MHGRRGGEFFYRQITSVKFGPHHDYAKQLAEIFIPSAT